jgi:hypothetical protein
LAPGRGMTCFDFNATFMGTIQISTRELGTRS